MPPHTLRLEHKSAVKPGETVVRLEGQLSLETVSGFNESIRAETAPLVILDLSSVDYIDSAGVGALVQLLVRCKKAQGQLALTGLNPRNRAVLEVAQVLKLFPNYASADEAAAHFA
jgi:anti-sigma B factor antagonist